MRSEAKVQRRNVEERAEKRGQSQMVDCFECRVEFSSIFSVEGGMLRIFEEGSDNGI